MRKLVVLAAILLLVLGFSGKSSARINIGINIPLPPMVTFSAPPELVVIPGTYVYYCPDVNVDILFYGGYWYRPYGAYWYRSASYAGPWVYIESAPSVLISLPHDYRIIARGGRRIPYADLHRNWRAWERERYWDHHNWGRPEHGRQFGVAPSFKEREHGRERGIAPQSRERGHGGFRGETRHEGHERR